MAKNRIVRVLLSAVCFAILASAAQAEVVAYKFTFGPRPSPGPYELPDGTTILFAFDTGAIWATGQTAVFSMMMWYALDMELRIGREKWTDGDGEADNTIAIQQWSPDYFSNPATGYYDYFGVDSALNDGGRIYFGLTVFHQSDNWPLFPYFGYKDPPIPVGEFWPGTFGDEINIQFGDGSVAGGRMTKWESCEYKFGAKKPFICGKPGKGDGRK